VPDDVFLIQLGYHPATSVDGPVNLQSLSESYGMNLTFTHKRGGRGPNHVVFHPYDRGVHKNQRGQSDPDGGARNEGPPLIAE